MKFRQNQQVQFSLDTFSKFSNKNSQKLNSDGLKQFINKMFMIAQLTKQPLQISSNSIENVEIDKIQIIHHFLEIEQSNKQSECDISFQERSSDKINLFSKTKNTNNERYESLAKQYEDLSYENYKSQYSSLIKNQHLPYHNTVKAMTPKRNQQEIDTLIQQFLSDSTDIHENEHYEVEKHQETKKINQEKYYNSKNIRVEQIDIRKKHNEGQNKKGYSDHPLHCEHYDKYQNNFQKNKKLSSKESKEQKSVCPPNSVKIHQKNNNHQILGKANQNTKYNQYKSNFNKGNLEEKKFEGYSKKLINQGRQQKQINQTFARKNQEKQEMSIRIYSPHKNESKKMLVKSPLKIEIEIPLIDIEESPVKNKRNLNELKNRNEQVEQPIEKQLIKQISYRVMALLNKSLHNKN